MNGNALISILATFGLLIASLWVSFDIFTSGSNAVARFYMYALVGCGVYGLLNARKAFFVLLFLTGYLDFFKRFMVFDSALSRMDLYYVLGIAPATMAGIVGNILYQYFTGKIESRPGLSRIIVVTLGITLLAATLALTRDSDGFRSIGDTVNSVAYLSLIFVVPILFPTPEDLRRMLKFLVVVYFPSVCYMLAHYFHGSIFDWEMDYVKSGLTGEIRQLMERVFRPFGTLNSAANASMVFAAIIALCFSGMWTKPDRHGEASGLSIRWIMIPMLALAMFATYSRAGWIMAVLAILAPHFLKSRGLTIAGYAIAFTTVVSVILASPYLLKYKILNEISQEAVEQKRTDQWAQTVNISTLNDRLEGFYALATNPNAWTPFGLRFGSASESAVRAGIKTHDKFTELLLDYGYVAMTLGFCFAGYGLWKLHQMLFSEKDPLVRSIGTTCLSIALAITSGGLVNGAQFMTYPTNVFIWLNLAVVVSLAIYVKERDKALPEPAAEDAPPRNRNLLRGPAARPPGVPAHAKA